MAEKDKMIHSLQKSQDTLPSTAVTITELVVSEESIATDRDADDTPNDHPKMDNGMSLSPPIGRLMSMEEQQSREEEVFQRINTLRVCSFRSDILSFYRKALLF